MKLKFLVTLSLIGFSVGIAQAAQLDFSGSHRLVNNPGNQVEDYFFNITGTGSVDVFMQSQTTSDAFLLPNLNPVPSPAPLIMNAFVSLWKKNAAGTDWDFVASNDHADRNADGSQTVYGTTVNGWIPGQVLSGTADPGLTQSLDAGAYRIVQSHTNNQNLGNLLSLGFAGNEHDDFVEYVNTYDLTIRGDFVTAVPVPAAIWLFGSAMAGLGVFGRKRVKV